MRYLLHDVFIEAVNRNPEKIAIIAENDTPISYRGLNTLSNKYADFFRITKNGNNVDSPYVGVISSVKIHSIAAIIGVLKIGCSYIPLDEYSPVNRLLPILRNTKMDTLVVDSNLYKDFLPLFDEECVKKVIVIGKPDDVASNEKIVFFEHISFQLKNVEIPQMNQVSDDLAYVLHSSGSTGVPKGIMLTHRNARTFVDWMHKEFEISDRDIIMSRAPFKFDLSVFDIFNTFKASATLVCFDWNKLRTGDQKHIDFVNLMEKEKVSVLYTTPSTLISLMNRGGIGKLNLNIRLVMYAGEPFPTPQLRKLQNILLNTRIANIYGPTETNIITYYWVDIIPKDDAPIPLGYVVDDTEILIVSEDGKRICNPNEMGEIWCRGGTVTMGYLGMEEETSSHKVLSPFHKFPAFFWRTGDYGFRDEKNVLHYRGRKDHMIKVKGYRIEIGEVELALSSIGEIDEFVVVAIPDEKYGNRLYCIYSELGNRNVLEPLIISHLKTKIPEYMIPFRFIKKSELPKTSSGKIDRVLLMNEILTTFNQ